MRPGWPGQNSRGEASGAFLIGLRTPGLTHTQHPMAAQTCPSATPPPSCGPPSTYYPSLQASHFLWLRTSCFLTTAVYCWNFISVLPLLRGSLVDLDGNQSRKNGFNELMGSSSKKAFVQCNNEIMTMKIYSDSSGRPFRHQDWLSKTSCG